MASPRGLTINEIPSDLLFVLEVHPNQRNNRRRDSESQHVGSKTHGCCENRIDSKIFHRQQPDQQKTVHRLQDLQHSLSGSEGNGKPQKAVNARANSHISSKQYRQPRAKPDDNK
jgi:hypothetical protein